MLQADRSARSGPGPTGEETAVNSAAPLRRSEVGMDREGEAGVPTGHGGAAAGQSLALGMGVGVVRWLPEGRSQ